MFDGRNFQFWHYKVSHGELLIRSPKSADNIKNIDIMFCDVMYVELPRFLPNMKVEGPTNEDVIYIQEKMGQAALPNKITVIMSENHRYFVVATFMKIIENELEFTELPFQKVGTNAEYWGN